MLSKKHQRLPSSCSAANEKIASATLQKNQSLQTHLIISLKKAKSNPHWPHRQRWARGEEGSWGDASPSSCYSVLSTQCSPPLSEASLLTFVITPCGMRSLPGSWPWFILWIEVPIIKCEQMCLMYWQVKGIPFASTFRRLSLELPPISKLQIFTQTVLLDYLDNVYVHISALDWTEWDGLWMSVTGRRKFGLVTCSHLTFSFLRTDCNLIEEGGVFFVLMTTFLLVAREIKRKE